MKRQIDFRFLGWLVVGTTIICVCSHFVHAFQMQRNAHILLEEGDRAEEKGNVEKAAGYLRNYLLFEPGDNSAWARYGIVLAKIGEKTESLKTFEQAYFALERVLQREPERDDVRTRSIEIAMRLGRFKDAASHLEHLWNLANESSADDKPEYRADLEYKRGLCFFGQQEYTIAGNWFKKAKDHAPANLKYYLELAKLYQKYMSRSEDARNVLEEMVKNNAGNFKAHFERARFLVPLAQDNEVLKDANTALHDAEESLKKALDVAPTDPDVLILSAAVKQSRSLAAFSEGRRLGGTKGAAKLQQSKDFAEEARKYLVTGIKANKKSAALRLELVYLERQQGNLDKALEAAEQARNDLKDLPGESDCVVALADLLVEKDKIKDAQELLTALSASATGPKKGPDENLMGYLQARIHMKRREWSEAEPILTRIRPLVSNKKLVGRLDYMVGLCYESLGNPDQALLVYQESVKNDPANMMSRLKVAGALAAQDRLDEAIHVYQQVQAFAGAPAESDLALVRVLLQKNRRLAENARHWPEVMNHLKRAQANFPGRVEVTLLKAEVLFQMEQENQVKKKDQATQKDEARDLLMKSCKAQPEKVELWLGLASLVGREYPEKGLAILEDAAKEPKLTDRVSLMLGKMSLLSRLPRKAALAALAHMEEEVAAFKPSPKNSKDLPEPVLIVTEQQRLRSGLALAYFKAQAPEEAARLWKPIAEAQKLNLGLRLILCDLALVNKDVAEADYWLKDIKNIEGGEDGDGYYWRYGTAFRLVQQVKPNDKGLLSKEEERLLTKARILLEKAAKFRPSWYAIPALDGQMDDLEGNQEQAIDKMQRAVGLGDRRAGIIRRLVELLLPRKRYNEAEQAIRTLIDQEQTLLAAGLGKLAAQSLLFSNEVGKALDLAQKSVKPGSADYKDHLWLGQIMWSVGKKQDAKEEIALACKYGPKAPETWETYIRYLTTLKENKKAEEVLAQAMKNLPAENLSLTLAHCYDLLDKRAEAENQFLTTLGNHPDDKSLRQDLGSFYIKTKQFHKAEKILVKLMEAWDTSPMQKSWARRNMAAILANKMDFRNFQKAMDLLDENHKRNLDSNKDQRTRALIMAHQVMYRREAIRLLEDLDRMEPLSVEDRFVLVKLYEATDNRGKLKRHMLVLLTSREEKPPALYAYYIRFLLQNRELDDAQAWQKQLAALAPKSSQAVETQARILHAQDQEADAVRLLQDFANAEPAKEENFALAVYLLDELGKTSKKNSYLATAEALHRQWAQAYPDASAFLSLAQFLGRHQRVGEALDYCEKFLARKTRDAALTAAESVLRANPTAKEHFPRVEAWYKKAYQENPTVTQVVLQADFYDLQERYDEAIVLYRQILQKDAENRFALNNLAWLLAMHQKSSKALAVINKALEVVGPIPEYLDTRGVIELTLNKTREAEIDLEKAAEMSPSANTLYHLARVQLEVRDVTKARTTYLKAKAAGIKIDMVHPLERRQYNLVTAQLERKNQ